MPSPSAPITRATRPSSPVGPLAVALLTSLLPTSTQAQQRIGDVLQWHDVEWSGGTLDVALVRPAPGTPAPHPVILALPWGAGSAQLVETFVGSYWLTEPAARGYYVVAPEVRGSSLSRTADDVLSAIFSWMDTELEYDPERVALVGASNGGSGAFFAAVAQPNRFAAIMTLPGQYSGPAGDLAPLADTPIYFLVGQRDESWLGMTQETRAALESQGIPSGLRVLGGQGHVLRIDPTLLVDWIDQSLER